MARLELEVGTDVLLLENDDTLKLEAAVTYIVVLAGSDRYFTVSSYGDVLDRYNDGYEYALAKYNDGYGTVLDRYSDGYGSVEEKYKEGYDSVDVRYNKGYGSPSPRYKTVSDYE